MVIYINPYVFGGAANITDIDNILQTNNITYYRFDGEAENTFFQDMAATIPAGLNDPVRYIIMKTPAGQVYNFQTWDENDPVFLVDLDGYKAIQGGQGFTTDVNTLSLPLVGDLFMMIAVVEGPDLVSNGGPIMTSRNAVAGGYNGAGFEILTPDTFRILQTDAILNVGNKTDIPGFDTSGRFVVTILNNPNGNITIWRNGVEFFQGTIGFGRISYTRNRIHRAFAETFPGYPYKVNYDGRTPALIRIGNGDAVTTGMRQDIEGILMSYYNIS